MSLYISNVFIWSHLYYTGLVSLQTHARSHILLRSEMVKEAFVKICAQRGLRNGLCAHGGWGEEKRTFLALFMEFLLMPYTFILFCFYFYALAFKHIGHISAAYNLCNKELFSFDKS